MNLVLYINNLIKISLLMVLKMQIVVGMNDSVAQSPSTTWGYNSSTIADDFVQPFSQTDVYLFGVFIFIFLVFGVFANVLTILVIATSPRLRTIFHYFILSLCLSDTISALISWINWYRRTLGYDDFRMPDFVCVFYWGVDIWTSYVTALHILSFAILRLSAIQWTKFMNNLKSGYPVGLIWILAIWIIAFVVGGIPMGLFSGARPKDRTALTPDSKWPACTQLSEWLHVYGTYTLVAYSFFFYIPIVATVVVSILIGFMMIQKRKLMKGHMTTGAVLKRRNRERQAIVQLVLIVGSFLIGYLPFTAFEFYTFRQSNNTPETRWIDWHFGTAQYMCLRFSECLNPILYNLGSQKMWNETKKFLSRYCCCPSTFQSRNSPPPTTATPIAVIT